MIDRLIDHRHFIALFTFVTLWMGTPVAAIPPAVAASVAPLAIQADTIQPVRAPDGMVVSAGVDASRAGADRRPWSRAREY